MRVLKTASSDDERLEFEDIDSDSTPYAILSHTWAGESHEVLYVDVQNGTFMEKTGCTKVKSALQHARSDGYQYMWIDNCCIDKSSSAELSEALNAMYQFYESSAKCYAYLADVVGSSVSDDEGRSFWHARWWRRGWCLQELLAPKHLEFFAHDWTAIGTKLSLKVEICEITGIDTGYLDGSLSIETASIAKRMSWAALRETKRTEDMAYCLMGIFQVNMPMLYGEGKRAFVRLQREIMSHSDDQSLFAWATDDHRSDFDDLHGLLADHPRQFLLSGSVFSYTDWERRSPYSMTNRGLSIELHLSPMPNFGPDIFAASLQCRPWQSKDGYLDLFLKKLPGSVDQYARVACNRTGATAQRSKTPTAIFVKQSFPSASAAIIYPHHFFILGTPNHRTNHWRGYKITRTIPSQNPSPHYPKPPTPSPYRIAKGLPTVFKITKDPAALTVALVSEQNDIQALIESRPNVAVLLGSIAQHEPGFDIIEVPSHGIPPPLAVLRENFAPQKMGTEMMLGAWRFTVTAEEALRDGQKIYYVDLFAALVDDPVLRREGLVGGKVEGFRKAVVVRSL